MRQFDTILRTANRFDLSKVLRHYVGTTGRTRAAAMKHAAELRRYLALRAFHPGLRFPMVWGPVDEFWHTFLLFTVEYVAFCESLGSGFLHHFPGPLSPTEEEIRHARRDYEHFLVVYAELLGAAPPLETWPAFDGPNVRWSC